MLGNSFEKTHTDPVEPGQQEEELIARAKEDHFYDKGESAVKDHFTPEEMETVLGKISRGDQLTTEESEKMKKVRENMGDSTQ